jgi:hypothetical protein
MPSFSAAYPESKPLNCVDEGLPIAFQWGGAPAWRFAPPPTTAPTETVALAEAPITEPLELVRLPDELDQRVDQTGARSTDNGSFAEIAWQRRDRLAEARAKVNDICGRLEVPAEAASRAGEVLTALQTASLPAPDRVVVSADQELAFVFFSEGTDSRGAHRRVATLTCSQDGISSLLQDRDKGTSVAWDVEQDLFETLGRIEAFLTGR